MTALVRRWFLEFGPVSRTMYARDGFALMVLKFLTDTIFLRVVSGVWWTPFAWLSPGITVREEKLNLVPAWALAVLVAWCLPFIWVGVSYSLRRAIDAGRSPWVALWFFIPIANYVMMLALALAPSAPERQELSRFEFDEGKHKWRSAALAVGGTIAVGLGFIYLSTIWGQSYGVSLFFAMPAILGFLAGWIYNRDGRRPLGELFGVVASTLVALGLLVLLFAWEGAICLVFAIPLAIPLTFGGAVLGRIFAEYREFSGGVTAAILILPVGLAVDTALPPLSPPRVVMTSVEVDATPEEVWEQVIHFSPLPEPTELIFKAGVAYPIRARLLGEGVGAIRYCEFSTGAFVEPITVWEPGRRLAFDVADQPEPMRELTPYRRITPAHLESGFRSERGEFLLVPLPDGRTRLEGRTWYRVGLAPAAYWSPLTDRMIHTIHLRVLAHVKAEAER